jgi:membrane protease YdiL (CAAX protease family)
MSNSAPVSTGGGVARQCASDSNADALRNRRTACLAAQLVFSSERMPTAILHWDLVILLLALAILVPWRGVQRVRTLLHRPDDAPGGRVTLYFSTMIAQWLFVAVTAWRCAARGFGAAGLGLAPSNPAVLIAEGIALALPFALTQLAGFRALARVPVAERGRIYEVSRKLMPRNAAEASVFAMLVATVSLCEEFLYRGFAFALFLRVFHSSIASLVASSLLFGIGHLYQGRRGVLLTSLLGLVFGGVRIFTGSLVPGVIAHFVVDLLAGFASPGGLLSAGRSAAVITAPDIN